MTEVAEYDLGYPLGGWRSPVPGAASSDLAGCLIFAFSGEPAARRLQMADPRCLAAVIRLSVVFRFNPGSEAALEVESGGIAVCQVSPDGTLMRHPMAENLSFVRRADGFLQLEVIFFSTSDAISLLAAGPAAAAGGRFTFADIKVFVSTIPRPSLADRLIVLEYGPHPAPSPEWRVLGPMLRPIQIWPDYDAHDRLHEHLRGYPDAMVASMALTAADGERVLQLTANRARTSLLAPDPARVAAHAAEGEFERTGVMAVDAWRLDRLVELGEFPAPDVLSIHAAGAEIELLAGATATLKHCQAVQCDAWLNPLYHDQALLPDIIASLENQGFALVQLVPLAPINGTILLCRARFLPRVPASEGAQAKRDMIRRVWDL